MPDAQEKKPSETPATVGGEEVSTSENANSDTMSPEELRFAQWLIGQQQQQILKSQRIIDETKKQYGLKS